MLTVLSLFDERSRPKGSRDPLGIEAIWSFLGRKVVGNLTTVTGNLDNFIVSLLCCQHGNSLSTELPAIQGGFLRAEQLSAYLRLSWGNESFLGITRAKANWKNGSCPLGRAAEAQILSNQLSYGLWGLYSTAMQVAGLIGGAGRKPTEAGQALIQQLLAHLGDSHWQDFTHLAGQARVSADEISRLAPAFNTMLADEAIRSSVVQALLGWQADCSLQTELFARAKLYLGDPATAGTSAKGFCGWLVEQPDVSEVLKGTVRQIQAVEPLLVLAATVMEWLQGQRNRARNDLIADLEPCLGGLNLQEDWAQVVHLPHRSFLHALHSAAMRGDADAVIRAILEQNRTVMRHRGGAPWLEWEGERLKVRVANDRPRLPERLAEHCLTWWNSYFIGSFLLITREGLR